MEPLWNLTAVWVAQCTSNVEIYFFLWRYTTRQVMSSSLFRFLDHTQRCAEVGKAPVDDRSTSRRNLYLTTHNTHYKYPYPWRDSNLQSQQASGRRRMPKTARALGPVEM